MLCILFLDEMYEVYLVFGDISIMYDKEAQNKLTSKMSGWHVCKEEQLQREFNRSTPH